MKVSFVILPTLCLAVSLLGQVDENDPYSVKFVQTTLRNRAQGLTIAKSQTHLARMGDGASIALLKALSDSELSDPHMIEAYLPIIRGAFSEPQFVTTTIDRKPSVTLFLLKHLQKNASNNQTRQQIGETIQFIKAKTGE
jgi:hypothetical protein